MSASNRIAGRGLLSRSKAVQFTFDGKTYEGLEGDTLASALLANGVHLWVAPSNITVRAVL